MKSLFFAVMISICGTASIAVAMPYQASKSGQQQQLQEQRRSTLQSARTLIKASALDLDTNVASQKILGRALGDQMPGDLVEGLIFELKYIQLLRNADAQALVPIVDAETSLVDGKNEYSIADVEKMITSVDDVLGQIGSLLKSKHEPRQAYKKRMSDIIDVLIRTNPKDAGTYIKVKIQLDPDLLDQELATQRSILTSLFLVLQSLR